MSRRKRARSAVEGVQRVNFSVNKAQLAPLAVAVDPATSNVAAAMQATDAGCVRVHYAAGDACLVRADVGNTPDNALKHLLECAAAAAAGAAIVGAQGPARALVVPRGRLYMDKEYQSSQVSALTVLTALLHTPRQRVRAIPRPTRACAACCRACCALAVVVPTASSRHSRL